MVYIRKTLVAKRLNTPRVLRPEVECNSNALLQLPCIHYFARNVNYFATAVKKLSENTYFAENYSIIPCTAALAVDTLSDMSEEHCLYYI